MKNSIYKEEYLIRQRTFKIESEGIRVKKSSFFSNNEIFYPIEEIGPHIQFDKSPLLFNTICTIVMLIIGINILINTSTDSFIFIIGTSLIGGGVYWLISTILNLEFIGSYYFSHSTKKNKGALEIKSSYPASENLKLFLEEIIQLQTKRKINSLVENINIESKYIYLEKRAKEIKRTSNLTSEEYDELIVRIKQELERITEDNT